MRVIAFLLLSILAVAGLGKEPAATAVVAEARVSVVDRLGSALPGAVADLCRAQGGEPRRCSKPAGTYVAGRDGELTVQIPRSGSYWLLVSLTGFYESWIGPLSATRPEEWQPRDLELKVILNADPAQTVIVTS